MEKILVTGGLGYIGSHTIVDLIENGKEIICIDSEVNADKIVLEGIEKITGVKISYDKVDLKNEQETSHFFENHKDIHAIIHFAALKSVGESVKQPLRYYENNVLGLINVLKAVEENEIPHFIFSSSCTVYGNPDKLPVTENTVQKKSTSPYGISKQMCEDIIVDFYNTKPHLKAVLLRYFNPAGAHESTLIGESPKNKAESLVPIITETAMGKRDKLYVHGSDYPTRDGTCIRDYIHVMDLANAHTKALEKIILDTSEENIFIYNLGIGEGVTVLEAIHSFEKVNHIKLNYELGPRRPGDSIAIYSNYEKAKNELHWQPERDINEIMRTAWLWEQKRSENEI